MAKYVQVVPKDISAINNVYKMTFPTGSNKFTIKAFTYYQLDTYADGADVRQLWILDGDEADINAWITENSDMVTEKTFAEANALGKELQPAHTKMVHKIITEDGVIVSKEDINKNIPEFDLSTV